MEFIFWIGICLVASIGLVQIAGWLVCAFARPTGYTAGYHVAILPTENGDLENSLRYILLCRRWSAAPQATYLVLLDGGLDEEGQAICRRLLEGSYGVFVCQPEELARTLSVFDDLQTREQQI